MKTDQERVVDRDRAIASAREILSQPYFIVDTETTGLKDAQMCQFGALYSIGERFCLLVKPTIPIEPGAESVHHITNEMVKDAPTADIVAQYLMTDRLMVIYNAPFDTKIIQNSLAAAGVDEVFFPEIVDAMQIYSEFRGEWNDYYGNYRWHKLEAACNQCGIPIDLTLHDALADCIMTDKLIHYIAQQKLSSEEVLSENPQ